MWRWCLCSALWWGVLWVCERPNLVVLLLALSGLGSGLFGTRKAPSLSVVQMLSHFVRDAGVVEVFVIRAWGRMAVLPDGSEQAGLPCVQAVTAVFRWQGPVDSGLAAHVDMDTSLLKLQS